MRILIIDGHPDPAPERFARALAAAYAEGARAGAHEVTQLAIAELDIAPLARAQDWAEGAPPGAVRAAQDEIAAADHVVVIFPLWLGALPAALKAFFEQVFRPGFAIDTERMSLSPGLLKGKSARVIVTMGMPALLYRWFFRAHSLRSLERNILKFAGFKPVRDTVIGGIEAIGDAGRAKWLERVRELGRKGR